MVSPDIEDVRAHRHCVVIGIVIASYRAPRHGVVRRRADMLAAFIPRALKLAARRESSCDRCIA